MRKVLCPYCDLQAELIDAAQVYRRSYGKLWICQPCNAWVGVHKDSKDAAPKGTLAKAGLRRLRIEVHGVFDPFWMELCASGLSKGRARKACYTRLATDMAIQPEVCHIAMFDEDQCKQAISICMKWREAAAEATASPESL
ncbi:MAG: zinc-finger-containing protein [Nitrospira sp.]